MAALKEARVPDIGDFSGIPVIELLVAVGDSVKVDQGLVTLESDKATMEVPAPFAGVVRELKVKLGDSVSEGSVVAIIEPEDAASGGDKPAGKPAEAKAEQKKSDEKPADEKQADQKQAEKKKPENRPDASAKAESSGQGGKTSEPSRQDAPTRSPPVSFGADSVAPDKVPYASPAVRLFARELGVDLGEVKGSARGGRITREDVQGFVKGVMQGGARASGAAPAGGGSGLSLLPWPKVDFSKFGETESQPLSRIKKISGANLARNWAMIPHVTQFEEADITEMEAFRKRMGEESKETKLTPLVFLIKAAVASLRKFPSFNASLDETAENLVLKKYFHIGIAVDTPNGLVVPVIRHCDQKGLLQLAAELGEISKKARDGKLGPADMSGGCFSISSLGGIGGTAFTPIINAPEVAILGVSKSQMKPVWNGKEFAPRLMLPLSLSYDHRVIDGAEAARFTGYFAQQLADLRRLLL
ncbi:dihydrolipoyllysine-residue acetyltransferase [Pseudomarimonas salicorniae]|uniref:Dihydrolipoamide acetyltransferase component of pyruvate dehydrogenase complex n=1 Tax=Pseudomarimonas salicorniae TaxID=2933270 RepID=A0ABT0GED5_9GAMM|nr:dihydrolipoyllysine-residue acetyltransferase [Lysobacter sp. CAU 1642]MCK7592914.1 dihydrolipoyllysine-residue acetyltransferase [Lysobacter sp. CAU 1642]